MAAASQSVRSVMFIGASFCSLAEATHASDQLHAAVDLLQFANAYVLNDVTIIAGNVFGDEYPNFGADDFLTEFINTEIKKSGSICTLSRHPEQIADVDVSATYDISQYWELAEVEGLNERISTARTALREAEKNWENVWKNATHSEELAAKEKLHRIREEESFITDSSHVRQMQSYMLFADHIQADVVPEYIYGIEAFKTYSAFIKEKGNAVKRKDIHEPFRDFSSELVLQLSKPVEHNNLEMLRQPCFLIEALRCSDTFDGVGHALRDLRDNVAVRNYRTLNQTRLYGETVRDRGSANEELTRGIAEKFGREGFRSRIPAFTKLIAGLSAFGVEYFFPQLPGLGTVGKIAPLILDGLDHIDKFIRRRRSPFLVLFENHTMDIYDELHSKFPAIKFTREELAGALFKRKDALRPLLKL